MTHRIEVVAVVDFPDGTRRVMFVCPVEGCCPAGHVEGPPGLVDDVVGRLVARHQADLIGEWLAG